MLDQLSFTIREKCLLIPEKKTLLAVSGGADSLFMLDIFVQLEIPLIVAHLDHGLRPSSLLESQQVCQIAKNHDLPFVLGRTDVARFAAEKRLSIEEAAREVRYQFLFEQAVIHHAQAVAVGHTADDQVETVLMHLLRGSGLDGLCGMSYRTLPNPWSDTIPIIRPLLATWRWQIEEYLHQRGLQPCQDASNLDKRFYRNRLRHETLPYLDSLNPGLRKRLWKMAELLGGDAATLDTIVEAAWKDCCLETGPGYVAYHCALLSKQPLGVQRRLIRRGIAHLRPGLRDIDYETVDKALRFLQTSSRSRECDLAAGLRLFQEGDRLWLAAWEADLPHADWPRIPAGIQLALTIPGQVELEGGWRIYAELIPIEPDLIQQALHNTEMYQVWLDRQSLTHPLTIRSRLPGDRFQPLGMEGHSLKLADFMINTRMPSRARSGWPLIFSGNQIVWVPGFRIGNPFAIRQTTSQLVKLVLQRSS